ncbi:hypothetical protein LC605_14965 [Nostoc sp. CHAB 5836]|nr:hypothetical protein [Nostoc sp. CHAB 5836]
MSNLKTNQTKTSIAFDSTTIGDLSAIPLPRFICDEHRSGMSSSSPALYPDTKLSTAMVSGYKAK